MPAYIIPPHSPQRDSAGFTLRARSRSSSINEASKARVYATRSSPSRPSTLIARNAASGDRTRAITETFAANENIAYRRMVLEALELLKGIQRWVRIIEMDLIAHRHAMIFLVIEKTAAACVCVVLFFLC